jgi:hypothetical protein
MLDNRPGPFRYKLSKGDFSFFKLVEIYYSLETLKLLLLLFLTPTVLALFTLGS